MSTTTTLQAGAWIFSGFTIVALAAAFIYQALRDSDRLRRYLAKLLTAEKAEVILGKPLVLVSILMLASVAFFVKALAYWAMFYGVGVTGPSNFWGNQLGWIFFLYFSAVALALYVCMRPDWLLSVPYGFAAAAGAYFVAAFASPANQLAFVLLGGVLALLLIVFVATFKVRVGGWAWFAIIAFAVVFLIGYALPYILSPLYVNSITIATALIWYLVADCVVIVWYAIMVFTAIECAIASKQMMSGMVCEMPPKANLNRKQN